MMEREALIQQLRFRTSRSSGPGGQSVNKTETRVEAILLLEGNPLFTEEEEQRLLSKLEAKINSDHEIVIAASDHRSQLRNKELAIDRMHDLLEGALKVRKPRKRTRPSKSAIRKRLKQKSQRAEIKQGRRWKLGD